MEFFLLHEFESWIASRNVNTVEGSRTSCRSHWVWEAEELASMCDGFHMRMLNALLSRTLYVYGRSSVRTSRHRFLSSFRRWDGPKTPNSCMEVTTLCHVETLSGSVRVTEMFTKQFSQSKCSDDLKHPVLLLRRYIWLRTAVKVKYNQETPTGSAQFIRLSPCYVCYHASSKLYNTERCGPAGIQILSCIWELPASSPNSETLRLLVSWFIPSVSKIRVGHDNFIPHNFKIIFHTNVTILRHEIWANDNVVKQTVNQIQVYIQYSYSKSIQRRVNGRSLYVNISFIHLLFILTHTIQLRIIAGQWIMHCHVSEFD
jgi:hypothetical protein